jgi:branched-chain amino acid transport system permease protein
MSTNESIEMPAASSQLRVGSNRASTSTLRMLGATLAAAVAVTIFQQLGINSELTYVAITVAISGLAGTGLAVLYGECGQMSVAHGGIIGMGAYATILMLSHGVPLALTLPAAPVIGCLAALLIGIPSLRLAGYYFVIATFAAAETMTIVATNLNVLGAAGGLSLPENTSIFSHQTGLYYVSFGALIGGVVLRHLIRGSQIGSRLIAIRENEPLARTLGVPTRGLKLLAFAFSGAVCGAAGFLFAFANQYVSPDDVGSAPGITLILVLVLGGGGTLLGPFIGAVIYYALPYIFPLSAVANQFATGVILIAVMLVLPQGLVGSASPALIRARAFTRSRRQAR